MAYSVDLRQRIVHAVLQRNFTLQQAADTFDVGISTVQRYLARQHETGDLKPKTSSGRPSGLRPEQVALFRQQLNHHDDLTLEQRCELWAATTDVRVSPATMSRWIKKLGTTRKKDPLG